MAYIKTSIENYGQRADFAQALKNFFVNNEVAPFEVVIEDFVSTYPTFTVERNNLNIKFSIGSSTNQSTTSVVVSSKNSEDVYVTNLTTSYVHAAQDNTTGNSSRKLQLLLAESDGTILFQLSAWNAESVSKGITVVDATLTNGENMIGTGMYSSTATALTFKEVTTQQSYTLRPFHIGTNDETKLIMSNQLAVNDSNGVYLAEVSGLQSAGGAKQFSFYTTELNTYYGLIADVCMPVGDKIEYVADVPTTSNTTE